jgi:hypothetical protein
MTPQRIGYWVTTLIVAFELLAGGLTDLVHGRTVLIIGPPVVAVITHLGYPVYLLTILGCWKLLGAVALVAPQLPRLKEWTYAGTFFEMSGAIASGVATDTYEIGFIWAGIVAGCALASWALRPQDRVLGNPLVGQQTPHASGIKPGTPSLP